jgi:hypothetical protein
VKPAGRFFARFEASDQRFVVDHVPMVPSWRL